MLAYSRSKAARQIFYDALFYFIVRSLANVAVTVIAAAKIPGATAALPFNDMVAITMGTRVYLNLKLLSRREAAMADQPSFLLDLDVETKTNQETSSDRPPSRLTDPICEWNVHRRFKACLTYSTGSEYTDSLREDNVPRVNMDII